jgi:cytochrome c oxidase subunit IV
MEAHVVPKKIYFVIFGTLLALTALTTGVAFINLGQWNTIVALIIACCKGTLVALFFMHLRWSPHMMRVVFLSALLWLAILISLTTTDFITRGWTPIPQSWETSLLRIPPLPQAFRSHGKTVPAPPVLRLLAPLASHCNR